MRGKKAKALRRIAAMHMMDKPERRLVEKQNRVNVTAVNHPDTVRGRYLMLKRIYKMAKRMGK